MRVIVLLLFLHAPAWALEGRDLLSGKLRKVEPGPKGLVAVFLSAHCPCSNSHMQILQQLAADYKDFQFVGIQSNADEPAKESAAYFAKAALPFPVLQDENSRLANEYKANRTPH